MARPTDSFVQRYSRRDIVLALLAIAVLLTLTGWAFAQRLFAPAKKSTAPASVPVLITRVEKIDEEDFTIGIGTVQAASSVTVRVRVDGQLQKLNFREGQDVKQGELLAQIDSRALQAQLEQARAQKQKDEALLANARIDLKRYEELVQLDSASRQILDSQRSLVAQLEATVRADQAQIEYAQVQLDYTFIRAPFSGRTGVRLVDPGNLVRAAEATGIVVVNQIDPINLTFTLPEGQISQINNTLRANRGQALKVLAFGREKNEVLAEGGLLVLNNQVDTATGTIQLKASFPNHEHRLWPGQFVNARLSLGKIPDALVLPASAIQRGPEGTFVYAVSKDRMVEVRPVRVTRILEGKAILSKGVEAGEEVVAEGQVKLRPGMPVTEAKADEVKKKSTSPQYRKAEGTRN